MASLMGGFVFRWDDPRGPIDRSQRSTGNDPSGSTGTVLYGMGTILYYAVPYCPTVRYGSHGNGMLHDKQETESLRPLPNTGQ
jgi:hypothetical protein